MWTHRFGGRVPARIAALGAFLLVVGMIVGGQPSAAVGRERAVTAVTVDGHGAGRTFDGVGAISGGGGNTRLLTDYPARQRGQILDYLFRPGYGAALQILKVEIGGDTNSTDGAEASHEHSRGAVNCGTGYEWWLMEQAKARNPGIKLYGLAWGAPGWIGNTGSGGNFWSQDTVDYLVSWLGCARRHGLTIDYLGGWNERGYNAAWYEKLHAALAADGYRHTQVVGADSGWDVATAMRGDPAFGKAVDIVGTHYPCSYMSAMTQCSTTSDALATGKQLWASENGSEDYNTGGAALARAVNRGYIDARLTAYINWPVVAAVYPNLPYNTMGLVTADQPWSGAYSVGKSTWATAHTTQFTRPGWHYIDTASGYLGGARANGSYVTLRSPDSGAWSTVAETLDATAAQTMTLRVTGGLAAGALHVWSSDFNSDDQRDYMVRQPDLTPVNGVYTLSLQPGRVYSVTTTTGQGAGTARSAARGPLPLPYRDDFEHPGVGGEARLLAAQQGSFEAVRCGGGRGGTCVQQMAPTAPINWDNPADPYATLGDLGWTNYTVAVDTRLTQDGAVRLLGRVGTQSGFSPAGIDSYDLSLSHGGGWAIERDNTAHQVTVLAQGTDTEAAGDGWHRLALGFDGSAITASIDGHTVGTADDTSYGSGQVGIGTAGYVQAQYDNLSVTPGPAQTYAGTYRLVNRNSGKTLDVVGQATADGSAVDQWTGNGGANQQWTVRPTGDGYYALVGVQSGKVLEAPGGNPDSGTQLDIRSGPLGAAGQWRIVPSGDGYATLENRATGMLADVDGQSTTDGARVIEWPSNGGANQQWQLARIN
ncbi:RICIN domain-containing protein [Streptomyces sp. RPT161]|uniref:RICIN domain-containing protein n=1 Tax=Streptomyces sp. RPT161 TaxID=3015993 RepID=UPI0022B87604|nr:RICIN domain-containing protein [Streptomyces sp. RPT161]